MPESSKDNRRYSVVVVTSAEQIPSALPPVAAQFALLLAIDATAVDDKTIRQVARLLLDRGLAYLCVWGPDCARVHDQFDLERDPNEAQGQTVMTTWHDSEPLNEAVWFFANAALADEGFRCNDWVAIAVGDEAWERELRAQLTETR